MTSLRDDQQALTRTRLLDAAARLFGRHGVHGVTLAQIAGGAGASTGAVYSNFEGKGDLVVAVIERHMQRQSDDYRRAFAAEGDSPGDRLRAGADHWMALVANDPDYFPLFLEAARVSRSDPALRGRFADACAALVDTLQALIEELRLPSGEVLASEATRPLALVVFALGNGLALHKGIAHHEVPDRLFGDFLAGLAATATLTPPDPNIA